MAHGNNYAANKNAQIHLLSLLFIRKSNSLSFCIRITVNISTDICTQSWPKNQATECQLYRI